MPAAKVRLGTHRESRYASRVRAVLDTIAAAVCDRAKLLDPVDLPTSRVSEQA